MTDIRHAVREAMRARLDELPTARESIIEAVRHAAFAIATIGSVESGAKSHAAACAAWLKYATARTACDAMIAAWGRSLGPVTKEEP